jgi:hypothetical protein
MLTRVPSTLPADVEDLMSRLIGAAIEVHRQLGRKNREPRTENLYLKITLRALRVFGTLPVLF